MKGIREEKREEVPRIKRGRDEKMRRGIRNKEKRILLQTIRNRNQRIRGGETRKEMYNEILNNART